MHRLNQIAACALVTGIVGCTVEIDGTPPLVMRATGGHAAFGPETPPHDSTSHGLTRCPYIRGATLGFSVRAIVYMEEDPATNTCRNRR